jgi:hypothetical protein
MVDVQVDLRTEQTQTFDIPISFSREQLEQMLRAVDGHVPGNHNSRQITATEVAVKKAIDLIEITKRRSRFNAFANLFADPAWFILLDLFVRQHSGLQTSVSSACHASFSPLTTALRHIAILTERNVIQRQYDPVDQRRVFLELTDESFIEIERILLADSYRDIVIVL